VLYVLKFFNISLKFLNKVVKSKALNMGVLSPIYLHGSIMFAQRIALPKIGSGINAAILQIFFRIFVGAANRKKDSTHIPSPKPLLIK
jgi:hypothetical protein